MFKKNLKKIQFMKESLMIDLKSFKQKLKKAFKCVFFSLETLFFSHITEEDDRLLPTKV